MPYPNNVSTIICQGYWYDSSTKQGVDADITFSPVPLAGSSATPNLTDLVSYSLVKTRVFTITPDPTTGYFAVPLIANDDPDLTAFGGWLVKLEGEDPFTITVPYSTGSTTATAQMAAAVSGITQGQSVQALWLTEAAVITGTQPTPPNSYLTAGQTASAIATAIAGVSGGGGGSASLTPTSIFTSNSHVPASGELARYNPSSSFSITLGAAASGQRFGMANVAASGSNMATFVCAGSDTFSDGTTSLVLNPGERAVLIGATGGFTIESRTIIVAGYTDEQAQDAVAALFAAGTHSGVTFTYDDAGNRLSATVTVTGDLPEYATTAQTAVVGTTANIVGKTTRYDTTSGALNQTLPAATAGRVLAIGWDAGSNALTFTAAGSDVIGSGSATTLVPAIPGETITLHCTTTGRWRTVSGFKPQSGLDARHGTILNTHLLAWAYGQAFRLVSATRDANEAITTASVVWPDGSTGTFTTTTASTAFPGAIDAYAVTYVPASGATKTISQAAVTRDAAGAVTAQPSLSIA